MNAPARKLRVALVFGGRSGEHEISLKSARAIHAALDPQRYEVSLIGIDKRGRFLAQPETRALLGESPHVETAGAELALRPGGEARALTAAARGAGAADGPGGVGPFDVVFPVLHGTYGEDGTIQGLFEMADLPYVGSGVLGSAAGMDKDVMKRLLRSAGLPVVDWVTVPWARRGDVDGVRAEIERSFGYPCFVKPANLGSSVGISKVKGPDALAAALATAFRFDEKVIVERGLDAREIECSVLGNDAPQASLPGEVIPTHEFYSYRAKYLDPDGARFQIPADLEPAQTAEVQRLSVAAFEALGCSGLARADFFVERGSGALWVNELNTMPGFTQISMYPKMWAASGIPFGALVDRLIELALERHARRRALETSYEPGESHD